MYTCLDTRAWTHVAFNNIPSKSTRGGNGHREGRGRSREGKAVVNRRGRGEICRGIVYGYTPGDERERVGRGDVNSKYQGYSPSGAVVM